MLFAQLWRSRPLDTARHLAALSEIMQNNLTLKQKFIGRAALKGQGGGGAFLGQFKPGQKAGNKRQEGRACFWAKSCVINWPRAPRRRKRNRRIAASKWPLYWPPHRSSACFSALPALVISISMSGSSSSFLGHLYLGHLYPGHRPRHRLGHYLFGEALFNFTPRFWLHSVAPEFFAILCQSWRFVPPGHRLCKYFLQYCPWHIFYAVVVFTPLPLPHSLPLLLISVSALRSPSTTFISFSCAR